MALEVCELIAVQLAKLLPIPKRLFFAEKAEEFVWAHVFSQCRLIVVSTAVVDPLARIAIVKAHLFHHESKRVFLLLWGRDRLTILLLVQLKDHWYKIVSLDLPVI